MTLVAIQDETLNPLQVLRFGTNTVMLDPEFFHAADPAILVQRVM
jgi:hypothetical protein